MDTPVANKQLLRIGGKCARWLAAHVFPVHLVDKHAAIISQFSRTRLRGHYTDYANRALNVSEVLELLSKKWAANQNRTSGLLSIKLLNCFFAKIRKN